MKPLESWGLTIESANEARTMAAAFTHLCAVIGPEHELYDTLDQFGTVMQARVETHELTGATEPFSFNFMEQAGRDFALTALRGAMASHPEEGVRNSAATMVREYEEGVLNASMEATSPHDPDPREA